ncbi:ATP synthase F1 subunit delta [Echinicola jeungdonensis]|uniref:ATP synthase subunit delta n=1 Tax=Echinicola jeungdonensis TaxID=709343 RepID=A0ABV5J1N5_9BACT|nr:ATP synthase F1 subunit delta [Echinicola jeungdonensis]MDN3668567.1 ATP synthase F1 subunit delta [Echinicola jeungdonensis]
MSVTRVASRYAKSLLELALEKGILEDVHQDMQQFLDVVKSNRDFALLLKNPIIKSETKGKVLNSIFSKASSDLTLSFFDIISRKSREDILPAIAKEFHDQYNLYKGIQIAELTTSFEVDPEMKGKFADIVKEISGKSKVELIEKKDKNIIGGFVLKVNDRLLDESLSSKLRTLRLEFSQNGFEKQI